MSSTSVDPSTSSSSTSTGSSESTAATMQQLCGLEDLAPGTANPIVSGTEAMQIPPDIGEILVASCGCHLADDLGEGVPDYPSTGGFDMSTWAGWQAEHPAGGIYHEFATSYLDSEFMPLKPFCNVDGEGAGMDPALRAVLLEWASQGAPDGATWVP